MKTLHALFAAVALTAAAGVAQADVRPDQIPALIKSGAVMDFEKLNKLALDKHPGFTIHDTELDHDQTANRYVYQVELRDAKNVEWDVDLDAKTGEVLKDKQDN
jgi:uncharacterized membrane protein YkoI